MTPTAQSQPKMINVLVRGRWEGEQITITTRNVPPMIVTEMPILGGGENTQSPMEYVAAALITSQTALFEQVAKELDFSYEGLDMKVEGELDSRGLQGAPGIKPLLQDIRQTVRVKTAESPERMVKVKREVEQRCPVFSLFKAAGINPHTVWERTAPIRH